MPVPSPLSADGGPIVPSVVGWNAHRQELVVGHLAEAFRGKQDAFVAEIKRQMGTDLTVRLGDRLLRPQEVSAILLKRLTATASENLGFPIEDVVVTVPANFKDAARQATLDAAAIAGLKVQRLIPEPTAAALAFGITHFDVDERILVFDFGGGTLDITLLQMSNGVVDVDRVDGDEKLGGKDMDQAICDAVLARFNRASPGAIPYPGMLERARKACEQAKVRLSQFNTTPIYIEDFARQAGASIPLDVELSRAELDRVLSPILDRAVGCLRRLLVGDGGRLRSVDPRAISRVLMVGGTTYVPSVRQRVAEFVGREVSTEVNPDLAVSLGASVQAALLKGVIHEDEALVLADVSPFSVGVEVVQPMREGLFVPGVFCPLIERNQPIPHHSVHQFSLMHPDQKECIINVFQGNSSFVAENEKLGTVRLQQIPKSTTGEPRSLRIEFTYNADGLAHLIVTVPDTPCRADLEVDARQGRMTPQEQGDARARLQEDLPTPFAIEVEAPPDEDGADVPAETEAWQESQTYIARARRLLRTQGPTPSVETALNRLLDALKKNNEAAIVQAQERLLRVILEEEGN